MFVSFGITVNHYVATCTNKKQNSVHLLILEGLVTSNKWAGLLVLVKGDKILQMLAPLP